MTVIDLTNMPDAPGFLRSLGHTRACDTCEGSGLTGEFATIGGLPVGLLVGPCPCCGGSGEHPYYSPN